MRKNKNPILDLHGRTADEVFDLLDRFIRQNKNQERIVIIAGKGRGIVKKKVLEYLKLAHYSWTYERPGGAVNEGALIIDLS